MKEAAVSLKHYIYFIVQSFAVDHWLNQFNSDLFGDGEKNIANKRSANSKQSKGKRFRR
jgi:hypothetical protein